MPALTVQAEAGDPEAMVELGIRSLRGREDGDFARAVALFRAAADKGYPAGMRWLGTAYEWGGGFRASGNDVNMTEAVRWYRKAAEAGDADAMYTLGGLSERGAFRRDAPPTNEQFALETKEALGWYRLAAERGSAPAMLELADRYETGKGVVQDAMVAARWFRAAAEAGDWKGMAGLSNMLEEGEGIPPNPAEAKLWAERATVGRLRDLQEDVSHGITSAMIEIAEIYAYGRPGVAKEVVSQPVV